MQSLTCALFCICICTPFSKLCCLDSIPTIRLLFGLITYGCTIYSFSVTTYGWHLSSCGVLPCTGSGQPVCMWTLEAEGTSEPVHQMQSGVLWSGNLFYVRLQIKVHIQPPTLTISYMYCTGGTECLRPTSGSHSVCAHSAKCSEHLASCC